MPHHKTAKFCTIFTKTKLNFTLLNQLEITKFLISQTKNYYFINQRKTQIYAKSIRCLNSQNADFTYTNFFRPQQNVQEQLILFEFMGANLRRQAKLNTIRANPAKSSPSTTTQKNTILATRGGTKFRRRANKTKRARIAKIIYLYGANLRGVTSKN